MKPCIVYKIVNVYHRSRVAEQLFKLYTEPKKKLRLCLSAVTHKYENQDETIFICKKKCW